MSDMNLKVTPAELEAKAADFKSVMTQTKSLTDDMMNDVTGLSSSWTGDASASYINKFGKEVAEIGEKQRNQNRADRIR